MLSVEDAAPTLFLSSTYYDLRHVRADIVEFVQTQLGYRLLASEYSTFPVDPSTDTIENCRRRVENDVDLLVLLIGGRYGHVPNGSQHSVTNIEYLTARAKHIPIFAFVQRDVLALVPIWHLNPDANFSAVVDNPKLFEFIRQVREGDRVWTFPFDTAKEIVDTMRTQLAYQMSRGLRIAHRLVEKSAADGLTGDAFRIVINGGSGWPGRLLAQLIDDEVAAAADLRRNHERQLAIGAGESVADDTVGGWLSSLCRQGARLIEGLKVVIEQVLNEAFNTSDIAALRYGAVQIGRSYRDCFEWAARIRRAHVPEDWQPLALAHAVLLDRVIAEIESFGGRLRAEIDRILELPGDGPLEVLLTFHASLGDMSRINEELLKLKRKKGLA